MAVHPRISCGNQVPVTITPDFCGTGMDRRTRRQWKTHSESKRGAIVPIRGADLCGSEYHVPHTQTPWEASTLDWEKIKAYVRQDPSPQSSQPHPHHYLTLYQRNGARRISKTIGNIRPGLDHIVLPLTTRRILPGGIRFSFNPFPTLRHTIIRRKIP